ncbi:MAG: thiamine phosphate synthase [Gemmatimonadota bacterium]|nr:MAG: thiamine phosphate synthase [Gemmatimonadota bacterium]
MSRLRLVVITDEDLAGKRSLHGVVDSALRGGAPAIQVRAKQAGSDELFELAGCLAASIRAAGALLLVNDRLDVALAVGADGVHLGPDDLPVAAARRAAPEGFLVGYSTDDAEVARRAVEAGADYIGCGAVYPTTNKADAGEAIGLEGLRSVVEAVDVPVVGIGGITPERAAQVAATGAAGCAVIGAVMSASDPEVAARELLEAFEGGG